jgi:hypothetical protein
VRELGADEPVVRLNARESAIGTLIVTGAVGVVWESDDLVTGAAGVDGTQEGAPVSTAGNRPLLGFDENDALVVLRHLHRLRRALFVGDGRNPMGVQLFNGSGFAVPPGDGQHLFALSALRIGSLLELRAEPIAVGRSLASLRQEFGFVLTTQLTPRERRRR